jgi:hypothetical protein
VALDNDLKGFFEMPAISWILNSATLIYSHIREY